ncbi:hypothetical protein Aspvir_003288 [Aspergillus viridinutans]|uniref:Uncharacterized protein n=1 Tax=Aspergillus viridinutans TaxID=75553 RepID=A0A9P3C7R7_ASPVI|nr:uncharacterized protein Aspvir_003288 [Aspergillus viridinutans]GIK07622.1 hypothetical protein Aspvir_003288 [Aspergillus viridinutans]
MSAVVESGLAASMHAPRGASGSGGKRPRKGNGGRRPPGRGPSKGMKKKEKTEEKCPACGEEGHNLEECRLYGVVFRGIALAATRAIATQSRRPPVSRRHTVGMPQQHPRMNSRQRRTARRLAERQRQRQQQGQQAQEQLGRQEQAPREQLPQQQSPQEQRPQHSAELPMRPALQEPPEGASWADQIDYEAEKNAQ